MSHLGLIGAGASGVAALRAALRHTRISRFTLFDPAVVGRGDAFSSAAGEHLCNTPAGTMAIDADRPSDFTDWLREDRRNSSADTFSRRSDYRRYLEARFRESIVAAGSSGREIEIVRTAVDRVQPGPGGVWSVIGRDGTSTAVDHVVLSSGAGPEVVPECWRRRRNDWRFAATPYGPDGKPDSNLTARHASVLVLGTNLSAVDAVRSVLAAGGSAVMASPSGTLPAVRSSLPLTSPLPMSPSDFAAISADPRRFHDQWHRHVQRIAAETGRSSAVRPPRARTPLARLEFDVELALAGANVWQESVGEYIDLANGLWSTLRADHRTALVSAGRWWHKRYVSAMPVENGRVLVAALREGRLEVRRPPTAVDRSAGGWTATWSCGTTRRFSSVVCATGRARHGWDVVENGGIGGGTAGAAALVSADLDVRGVGLDRSPVWGIGSVTHGRFPVVNYMRTAVLQADRVMRSIAAADRGRV